MINPSLLEDGFGTVSDRTLRQFAGILVGFLGLLFALSWYRHAGVPTTAAWIGLAIAVGLGVPGLVRPAFVAPVFMGAMALTRPIGHAMSFALLGLLYYGLVTPLAAAFRLAGRDALVRRRPDSQSYWSTKSRPADVTRYLRQYQHQ